jgi:hypothetical protein
MTVLLTSALDEGEWSASQLRRFTPGERVAITHWVGGWVGPGTGLDDMEKRNVLPVPGLELRPLIQHVASRYTDCATPVPAETGKTTELNQDKQSRGNLQNCSNFTARFGCGRKGLECSEPSRGDVT